MEMTGTAEEVGAGHLLTDCYSIHTHTRALHIQIRLTGYHYPDLKTQQRHVAVCLRLCQTPPLPLWTPCLHIFLLFAALVVVVVVAVLF